MNETDHSALPFSIDSRVAEKREDGEPAQDARVDDPRGTVDKTSSVEVNACALKLVLVSGKTIEYVMDLDTTIRQIKQEVLFQWPAGAYGQNVSGKCVVFKDWDECERPQLLEELRLIYRGRFLGDQISLSGLEVGEDRTIALHLLIQPKEAPPDSDADSDVRNQKKSTNGTRLGSFLLCRGCTIS